MNHYFFPARLCTLFSLCLGAVLAVAAYGKIFYPTEVLKTLDRCVGSFEILFFLIVFYLRRHWQMWAAAAVVFGSWSGYALYWYRLKLPCLCMGEMLDIPTAFSVSLDLFFIAVCLFVSRLLGARGSWIYFSVLSICFALLAGYAFADWIYVSVIVKM
jgi:hypothetical protein